MTDPRSTQPATFQLFRLPKEKSVLDFVLQKMGDGASPERYELIESLLKMYRTSTGFDPFAMSKGRFKRLKAAEFRQLFYEIDQEIGVLIQSQEYRQCLSKQTDHGPLFNEYRELVQAVELHPALSLTGELESFENKCATLEAPEIQLSFYRHHAAFLEEIFRKEGPEQFLSRYDAVMERQRQLQFQFRLGFELTALEQSADKGRLENERATTVLQELGTLLTLEKKTNRQHQLLLLIIRAALLTASPARNLSGYLDFIEQSSDPIFSYAPEARRRVYTILAQYAVQAGEKRRLQWLAEAEKEARLKELHDERPQFRFIHCMIAADAGHTDAALKCLDEAEHLIYKASSRSLASRNTWVRLCEYRTLLYALRTLEGDAGYAERFAQLRHLAEDMGRHRNEISILVLEWKGLEHLLKKEIPEALACFTRAKSYRKNHPDHPWQLIDSYFISLLGKTKKKNEAPAVALTLKNLNEPFYSSVGGRIMHLAGVTTEKATTA